MTDAKLLGLEIVTARGGAAEEITMHPPASRVVFENMPYLVELDEDGAITRAFGALYPRD